MAQCERCGDPIHVRPTSGEAPKICVHCATWSARAHPVHHQISLHELHLKGPPWLPTLNPPLGGSTDPAAPLPLSEADDEAPTTPYGQDELPRANQPSPPLAEQGIPPSEDDWWALSPSALARKARSPLDLGSMSPFAIDDTLRSTPKPSPMGPLHLPASHRIAPAAALSVATLAGLLLVATLHSSHSPRAQTNASAAAPALVTTSSSPTRAVPISAPSPSEASVPPPASALVDRAHVPAVVETSAAPLAVSASHRPERPPSPATSEEWSALGDAALRRADYDGALSIFERVVSTNPDYVPARLSIADILWTRGDRVAAQESYARIVEEFPEALVPERARLRAEPAGTSQ